MMSGIKADLYLPKESLDVIIDRQEEVKKYFDSYFSLEYDIYLAEYNNEEVCGINLYILNNTKSMVENDYKSLKTYFKQVTGKTPKQILKINFDKIKRGI